MTVNRFYKYIFSFFLIALVTACKKHTADTTPVVDETINYELSNDIFPNPERGFMHTYITYSEGDPLNLSQLQLLRSRNISIVLRFFYLDAFKSQAISAAELTLMQDDLDKIREAGLKVILRFAYTDSIGGTDAPYAIIEQHLDQLKLIFENNKAVIAFVQAGFIGAYGEWHSSTNGLATTDNEKKVLTKLLSVLPQGLMVQVRTPGMKQEIFNTTLPVSKDLAYTADNRARVGHHNDCFLTGGTDYGTYNNVVAEKQYISDEALYVPTGGETCPPQNGYDPSCFEGKNEMKFLKWTYLNLDWYPPTINAWKTSGCFNEFQTNLGYRLALVSSILPAEGRVNTSIAIKISLTNKGYAPLYNKKNASLILKSKTSGQYYDIPLNADVRDCKPAGTLVINENISLIGIPAGDYELYLRLADTSDNLRSRIEYAVRLANTNVWVEDNGGMNSLLHSIIIKG